MSVPLLLALLAISVVVAGWIGYPMVAAWLARNASQECVPGPAADLSVSVVVATRESPEIVARRVENLRRSSWPCERLEIVVAVDRSGSYAVEAYRVQLGDHTGVVAGDHPGGKAATLNAGVRIAAHSVVVFADSQQEFSPDAITRLAEYLGDPRFGAVTGALSLGTESGEGSVIDLFWKYELSLRRHEAAIHSIVAVTGAIYAIRRALWTPLPAHLICDDLFVPLHVVMQGSRVGFCESARATDPRKFSRSQEFRRKVRTLTGMIQMCVWVPTVLLPWKNPIWVQFVCHKLLRLATPYLLIVAVLGTLPAMFTLPTRAFFIAGGLVLLGALAVWVIRPAVARRLVGQLAWAAWLLTAPLVACGNAVRGRWDVWGKA